MREIVNKIINKGVYNAIDAEVIPKEAASDSLGWRTVKDHFELSRGRVRIGDKIAGAGKVRGEYIGYTYGGRKVHLAKKGSKIQYHNPTTDLWQDVITGLDEAHDYTFAPFVSLAGNFVIISGHGGVWKVHLSSPTSALNMYDPAINYKGYMIINEARAFLWGREDDPTGLYLSNIDEATYTTVSAESIGNGDGSDLTFSGTIAAVATVFTRNIFGFSLIGKTLAATNISAITKAANAVVSSTSHGLVVGDKVLFASISGMTEMNTLVGTVMTVPNANSFSVDIDSRAFTTYTSGGTAQRVEVFIDDNDGGLESNKGGTGTINYATGAYSVAFIQAPLVAVAINASYQWEDSNNGGITDFTYTNPNRQAGEGDVFRQDIGGDRIVNVEVHEGSYFSIKERSVYQLTLSADDLTATNKVFRTGIGMPSLRASKATGYGILFLNTANPEKPELSIIRQNIAGDNLESVNLITQFDLSNYNWDDCVMEAHGEAVLFAGKTAGATSNDRVFEYNAKQESVDVLPFHVNTMISDGGYLHAGDSLSDNVHILLDGFDDDGFEIENYWDGNEELYGDERLKKVRRARFGGDISLGLDVDVYIVLDEKDPVLVGTIEGDGSYVNQLQSYVVGANEVAENEVGGGGDGISVSPFLLELRVRQGKFRKRKWRFIARGVGHVKMRMIHDLDLMSFDQKLPKVNRVKPT